MILAVETNILTTTIGIVALVIVAVYPDKNWYTCPTAIIGKLYSNTLLVSLNNRISLRDAPIRAAGNGPPAVVSVTSHPRILPGVMHVEVEKPSAVFASRQSDDSSGTRVFDIA
ncbi:hypothetical protein EDB87DRAFT_1319046 [Lactarius vividus]|nr:hypothetical protein EDB87DRAFT_1319046 [Lactarius vividus]